MSENEFVYSNSNMVSAEPKPDATKPGETNKSDGTLLSGEQQKQDDQPLKPQSNEPERNFYGETMRAEMSNALDPVFKAELVDPFDEAATADQKARREMAVNAAFSFGFETADVKEVDSLMKEYGNFSAEDHQARMAESYAAYLKEVPDQAESNLKMARAYLERPEHVHLRTWLSVTGLGNDLRVIRRVVSIARAAATRGAGKK